MALKVIGGGGGGSRGKQTGGGRNGRSNGNGRSNNSKQNSGVSIKISGLGVQKRGGGNIGKKGGGNKKKQAAAARPAGKKGVRGGRAKKAPAVPARQALAVLAKTLSVEVTYTITAGDVGPFRATAKIGAQKFKGPPATSKKLAYSAAAEVAWPNSSSPSSAVVDCLLQPVVALQSACCCNPQLPSPSAAPRSSSRASSPVGGINLRRHRVGTCLMPPGSNASRQPAESGPSPSIQRGPVAAINPTADQILTAGHPCRPR